MSNRKVRAKSYYLYRPVMYDVLDPPHGVKAGLLEAGQEVRVVKLPGCPPPNTMGHCHIETPDGVFLGLVCTNSLVTEKEYAET